jgi:xylan 1,4-beta-xylosidase
MSVGTQLRSVERGMKVIASYPEWRKTPIILGESDPEGCGACQSPQNGYRNGPLYGASVIEATMRTYELEQKYGLTVQGAVTWAFEFEDQPAFAPLRALATDGIDKPVLNAFRLMGKLGGEWVKTESDGKLPLDQVVAQSVAVVADVNAVATRNGNEVNVLVWNYHDADVAAQDARVQIAIDGLKGAHAIESELRVDATHSNAYRAWLEMGSPAKPSVEQVAQLEKAGQLEETVRERRIPVSQGAAQIELTLPRQGAVLVRIQER